MRKNRGITLITLIVTIIILLILAGVTLNLVAGSEGILSKATKAVNKNQIASLQEEVDLALIELKNNYYEAKYVDKNDITSGSFGAYVKEKLQSSEGLKTASGKVKLGDSKETVNYTSDDEKVGVRGTFEESTGIIILDGATSTGGNTEETPEPLPTPMKQPLVNQITEANYGDKVNYSVTLDKTDGTTVTLDNWQIFYNDGSIVTMICQDYVPNKTSLIAGTGLNVSSPGCVEYTVSSNVNRKDLIERLKDSSKWEGLLTNAMKSKGATAVGAVDLETWVASWNAKGYTKLYTAITIEPMEDGLNGYYLGKESNPSTAGGGSPTDEEYNDKLYYPIHSFDEICGYWLASPIASTVDSMVGQNSLAVIWNNGVISYRSFYRF